jgi:uncharacterized protein
VRFEWDPQKARSNFAKHRVSFEAAVRALNDPFGVLFYDNRFSDERWVTIGKSGRKVLYVAHKIEETFEEIVVRIISAREATRHERRFYVDHA